MSLPLTREEALAFLKEHTVDPSDFVHYLESEAIMGALAAKLDGDVEYWKMLGLLHDLDWGETKSDLHNHLTKAPEMLKEKGFDDTFIGIVLSHGYGFDCAGLKDKQRTLKVEHALACAETLTGLIHAYALMRGRKISDMEVKGLKKKFKDKRFAAAISRDIIRESEQIGLSLDEFFAVAIDAIKGIKEDVGLE